MRDELNYSWKKLEMAFHNARKLAKAYVKDRNVNTLDQNRRNASTIHGTGQRVSWIVHDKGQTGESLGSQAESLRWKY